MSKQLLVYFFFFSPSMIRYKNSNPVVGRILRYVWFGGSLKVSKANFAGLRVKYPP